MKNQYVLQVELGHISLPSSVKEALNKRIGSSNFITVEDLFSGKGLSDLYKVVAEGKVKSGEDISKAHIEKTDQHATQTLELFSEMLRVDDKRVNCSIFAVWWYLFCWAVSPVQSLMLS